MATAQYRDPRPNFSTWLLIVGVILLGFLPIVPSSQVVVVVYLATLTISAGLILTYYGNSSKNR